VSFPFSPILLLLLGIHISFRMQHPLSSTATTSSRSSTATSSPFPEHIPSPNPDNNSNNHKKNERHHPVVEAQACVARLGSTIEQVLDLVEKGSSGWGSFHLRPCWAVEQVLDEVVNMTTELGQQLEQAVKQAAVQGTFFLHFERAILKASSFHSRCSVCLGLLLRFMLHVASGRLGRCLALLSKKTSATN